MSSTEKIHLEIITPEGQVLQEMVDSIVAPGTLGSFGILADHAPIMSALKIGILEYTKNGQKEKVAISQGFLENSHNEVMVLVHTAELGKKIDRERALAAKSRAEKHLAEKKPELDTKRAEAALTRAIARIKASE